MLLAHCHALNMSATQNWFPMDSSTELFSSYCMFLMCLCVYVCLCVCAHGQACDDQEHGSYEIWQRCLQNMNRRILSKRDFCSYRFLVGFFPSAFFSSFHFFLHFPGDGWDKSSYPSREEMLSHSQSSYDTPCVLSD